MLRRLRALARILMTPAAIDLATTAYRSPTARGLARQAVRDPAGLARRLADPRESASLLRQAGGQVSMRDMAQLGFLFVPLRYGLLSELAVWGARRATGRGRGAAAGRPMKNVTPRDDVPPGPYPRDAGASSGARPGTANETPRRSWPR